MEKEKNSKATTLIPIAMMFLIIGMTFDETFWLKYTFLVISIILCIVSVGLSLKRKRKNS